MAYFTKEERRMLLDVIDGEICCCKDFLLSKHKDESTFEEKIDMGNIILKFENIQNKLRKS